MIFEQYFQPFINEWLNAFLDPQKRVFIGYLLSALLIAMVWLVVYNKQSLYQAFKKFFNKKSWLSSSARSDYLVMFLNSFIMLLISPKLLEKSVVAFFIFNLLHQTFSTQQAVFANLPEWGIAIGFTLVLFLVDDFARYWLHRWLHTIPVLWLFHQVHHSATSLNPFTVFRSHPVEAILFSIRGALVQGIVVAIFIYFFGNKVTLTTVLGANVFNFLFNALGSNLRHSPVSVGYWRSVEGYFMSPAQHHIHHSYAPEHIDKNFGVVLSCWDRFFKSICYSVKDQNLSYGINKLSSVKDQSLWSLYVSPLIKIKVLVANRIYSHLR